MVDRIFWVAHCLFPAVLLHIVSRLPYVDFNAGRLVEIALIASYLVCTIFFGALRKVRLFKNEILLSASALLFLVLLSTILSPRMAASVLDVLSISLLLLVCIQLATSSLSFVSAIRIFALFNVLALGAYEFVFLVGYVTGVVNDTSIHYKVLIHGVTNIRFFNQYQVWLMPILYWGFLHFNERNRRLALVFLGVTTLSWTMLFFSSARGAILSLTASILLATWFSKKYLRNSWLIYAGSSISGFALFLIMQYVIPALFLDNKPTEILRFDDSGRMVLWGYAFDLWYANPFLGVGPMNFASMNSPTLNAHPHNLILHVLAEWGGVAGLLVTLLVVRYVKWCLSIIRTLDLNDGRSAFEIQAGAAIIMSSLGAVFYSMLDGNYIMPLSQMTGVLVLSLVVKFSIGLGGIAAERICGCKATVFKSVVGLLTISWCLLALLTFAYLPAPGEPSFEIGPRFWISGYFPL